MRENSGNPDDNQHELCVGPIVGHGPAVLVKPWDDSSSTRKFQYNFMRDPEADSLIVLNLQSAEMQIVNASFESLSFGII